MFGTSEFKLYHNIHGILVWGVIFFFFSLNLEFEPSSWFFMAGSLLLLVLARNFPSQIEIFQAWSSAWIAAGTLLGGRTDWPWQSGKASVPLSWPDGSYEPLLIHRGGCSYWQLFALSFVEFGVCYAVVTSLFPCPPQTPLWIEVAWKS